MPAPGCMLSRTSACLGRLRRRLRLGDARPSSWRIDRHSARETIDKLLEKHPDVDVHFCRSELSERGNAAGRKVRRLSENVVQIDREALTAAVS